MFTTDDLRRALADEAEARTTGLTFADVKRATARRRYRTFLAGIAVALTPVLAAGGAIALAPSGPGPAPQPTSTTGPRVLPSPVVPVPPSARPGNLVATGLAFGDGEELVLWWRDQDNGVYGGLYNAKTTRLRTLGPSGHPPGGFGIIGELDDRHGGVIDYGVVGADGLRVTVKAGGKSVEATTAPIPGVPGYTLFWVHRGGNLAGSTADPHPASSDAVFTAYRSDGSRAAQSIPQLIQRADTIVNRDDTVKRIGDYIETGVELADGHPLVLWFEGDEHTGLLRASANPDDVLTPVSRPPSGPGGFDRTRYTFAGAPGRGEVTVCVYIGPAARVELHGDGTVQHGSRSWSEYPQVHVAWATGIQGRVSAGAYDEAGTVVAAIDFP